MRAPADSWNQSALTFPVVPKQKLFSLVTQWEMKDCVTSPKYVCVTVTRRASFDSHAPGEMGHFFKANWHLVIGYCKIISKIQQKGP